MSLREAAQMALEALDEAIDHLPKPNSTDCGYAVTALRAALEQQEQKQGPVAWLSNDGNVLFGPGPKGKFTRPLYTHPPRRETEQEPVAWMLALPDGRLDRLSVTAYDDEAEEMLTRSISGCTMAPLYAHPPRREWQGLTEEDIWTLAAKHMDTVLGRLHFARAVEQALRSKNNG